MSQNFSFDGALMHFTRKSGPPGFFWKFALAYIVLYAVAGVIVWMLVGPVYLQMMQAAMAAPGGELSPEQASALMAQIGLMYLVIVPLFAVVWVMLEGAVLRHYVRGEGFSLRLGGDELRLFVVGLLWLLLILGLYLAFALAIGIPVGIIAAASGGGSAALIGVLAFVLGLAALCFAIFVVVRFSPAGAMTVRDRAIRFSSAWGATKGRFWALFGAFLIAGIVSVIAAQIVQFGLLGIVGGIFASNPAALESGDFTAILSSPTLWIGGGLVLVLLLVVQAATQFVVAGIPSHAANTDPNGGGLASPVHEF